MNKNKIEEQNLHNYFDIRGITNMHKYFLQNVSEIEIEGYQLCN